MNQGPAVQTATDVRRAGPEGRHGTRLITQLKSPPVRNHPASGKPAITPKIRRSVNAPASASRVYRGLTGSKNLWITLSSAASDPYNPAAHEPSFPQ
jgi:hypothetical protein